MMDTKMASLKPFLKEFDEYLISHEEKAKKIYKDLNKDGIISFILENSESPPLLFLISMLSNLDNKKVLIFTSEGEEIFSIFNKYIDNLLLPYTVKYTEDEEALIAYLNTLPANIILTKASNVLKILEDFKASYRREYFCYELGLLIINEKMGSYNDYIIQALILCLSSLSSSQLYVLDTSNAIKGRESIPDRIKQRFLFLTFINSGRKIWEIDKIKNIWGEKNVEFLRGHEKIEFYDDKFQLLDEEELVQEYQKYLRLK